MNGGASVGGGHKNRALADGYSISTPSGWRWILLEALGTAIMTRMATKTAPNLSTVERLLDEVDEWCARVQEVRQRLAGLPRASEEYLDLLPDLEVELDTLRLKTQHALEALEEFEDSLPESD